MIPVRFFELYSFVSFFDLGNDADDDKDADVDVVSSSSFFDLGNDADGDKDADVDETRRRRRICLFFLREDGDRLRNNDLEFGFFGCCLMATDPPTSLIS